MYKIGDKTIPLKKVLAVGDVWHSHTQASFFVFFLGERIQVNILASWDLGELILHPTKKYKLDKKSSEWNIWGLLMPDGSTSWQEIPEDAAFPNQENSVFGQRVNKELSDFIKAVDEANK